MAWSCSCPSSAGMYREKNRSIFFHKFSQLYKSRVTMFRIRRHLELKSQQQIPLPHPLLQFQMTDREGIYYFKSRPLIVLDLNAATFATCYHGSPEERHVPKQSCTLAPVKIFASSVSPRSNVVVPVVTLSLILANEVFATATSLWTSLCCQCSIRLWSRRMGVGPFMSGAVYVRPLCTGHFLIAWRRIIILLSWVVLALFVSNFSMYSLLLHPLGPRFF